MELKDARIAVTGATGLLGRYIVRALLERDAQVICVVRNPDKDPRLRDTPGVEMRRADLADHPSLAEGFAGADAVVSNAALVSLGNVSAKEVLRTNIEGTENVFHALHEAGVARALQVSSCTVYDAPLSSGAAEDTPMRLDAAVLHRMNVYGISKARSEARAWELARAYGIELSVIRPGGIYGAFDTTGWWWANKLLMRPPVSGYPDDLRVCPVYAGDVAEAMCRMLERDVAAGRAYNVQGDDLPAKRFREACAAVGMPRPRLFIPFPCPFHQHVSTERIRTELDWAPRSYEEAVREILDTEAAAEA